MIKIAFIEVYDHVSRKIVGIFSTIGGFIGAVLPSADTQAPATPHLPTWSDFMGMVLHVLCSEDAVKMFVGACIGAIIGAVTYVIMWPVKRWLFKKYPISEKHLINDLKDE